jgi:hypothetical protein
VYFVFITGLSVSIFQSRIPGVFERQWWQSFSKF